MTTKEAKQIFRKLLKRWNRSADIDARIHIVADFTAYSVQRLTGVTSSTALPTLLSVDAEARMMCNKPILVQDDPRVEWCLHDDWYKMSIAQILDGEKVPTKELYSSIGWDYDRAVNPTPTDTTTIEHFSVNDIVSGTGTIKLLLESKAEIPVGSVVRNMNSGLEYDVVGHIGNRYELVGEKITLFRWINDIYKTFEVVR